MGVDRTDYAVLGIWFTYDAFFKGCSHFNNDDGIERSEKYAEPYEDNAHEEEITAPNGFAVIKDGTNGEYVIIGRILAKAGREGFDMTDCRTNWTESEAEIIKMLIAALFPFLEVDDEEVGVLVFTHWH